MFQQMLAFQQAMINSVWPKPLAEMIIVKLSYQLKLTYHTTLYVSD